MSFLNGLVDSFSETGLNQSKGAKGLGISPMTLESDR